MLSDLTPEQLSYLATTFAAAISKDLDIGSVRVLSCFFSNVSGNLNLITNQRILLAEHNKKDKLNPF